jgi:hypothetical protein
MASWGALCPGRRPPSPGQVSSPRAANMRELVDLVDRAGVEYVETLTKRDLYYVSAARRPAGHRLPIHFVVVAA